jgi:hypothetical protein
MSETAVPIETPQLLLDHHLKTLRLPTMLREYDRVARQCAAEDLDYPRWSCSTASDGPPNAVSGRRSSL